MARQNLEGHFSYSFANFFLPEAYYRFFPTFRLETINEFEYFFGVRVF